jgi:hypothetical protein
MNDARKRSVLFGGRAAFFLLLAAGLVPGGCAADGPNTSGRSGEAGEPAGDALGKREARLEQGEVVCGDGADNDLDGLVDCLDPDCSAQPTCVTKFACDGRALQVIDNGAGPPGQSDLAAINTAVTPWQYSTPFGSTQQLYNACGFNTGDGFLYCVSLSANANAGTFWRIRRGVPLVEEKLNVTIADFPGSSAADFDFAGNLWVLQGQSVRRVNVSTLAVSPPTIWPQTAADIAYNPDDNSFYGLNGNGQSLAILNTITGAQTTKPVTGAVCATNAYGSQWFDASGRLFASCNASGQIFRIDVRAASPVAEPLIGSGVGLSNESTDSATCPLARGPFEICGNGIDDDGDGSIDESTPTNVCIDVPDTDGDGVNDADDLDDDNDGIPDALERGDSDGDGVPDRLDLDSDNDGIVDAVEAGHVASAGGGSVACTGAAAVGQNGLCDNVETAPDSAVLNYTVRDTDGDGVRDVRDLDSDGDGITDAAEAAGGGGDANGDGRVDCPAGVGVNGLCDDVETANDAGVVDYDGNGTGPDKVRDTDGDLAPDSRDLDADNDGINDVLEAGGVDANGDGLLDPTNAAAPDADGDGLVDRADPDGGGAPLARPDFDGDGRPNFLDLDSDNDGRSDLVEGGSGGVDADDDGVVDGPDSDGDGIQNSVDGRPTFGDAGSPALPDGDAASAPNTPDYADVDSDGNGSFDIGSTPSAPLDANNDGAVDNAADGDNDGIADVIDEKPTVFGGLGSVPGPGPGGPDSDGDGLPDSEEGPLGSDPNDADSDDDGVPDGAEPTPAADGDGDGIPNVLDPDSDGDGIFDGTELGNGCDAPGVDKSKGNCIPDADPTTTTDPNDPDTDDGGVRDGDEDRNRDGRIDPGETDPNVGADDVPGTNPGFNLDLGSLEGGGLSCAASPAGSSRAPGSLGLAFGALAALALASRRKRAA